MANAGEFERVDRNLAWYSRKSGQSQILYRLLRIAQIITAAAIPVLSALAIKHDDPILPISTGILGMLLVILEGVQSTFQPLEKWMIYRAAAEELKREKVFYAERVGPYASVAPEEARKLFVLRTETAMASEHSRWQESNRPAAPASGN